jgi:hypothetical protein
LPVGARPRPASITGPARPGWRRRCPCPLLPIDGAGGSIRACPPCPIADRPIVTTPDLRPCPTDTGIPGLVKATGFEARSDAGGLVVTGTLTFVTGGYKAKLVPSNPQGINGDILLLDVVVERPTNPVIQVLTDVPVRYEQAGAAYSGVTIVDIGLNLAVTAA